MLRDMNTQIPSFGRHSLFIHSLTVPTPSASHLLLRCLRLAHITEMDVSQESLSVEDYTALFTGTCSLPHLHYMNVTLHTKARSNRHSWDLDKVEGRINSLRLPENLDELQVTLVYSNDTSQLAVAIATFGVARKLTIYEIIPLWNNWYNFSVMEVFYSASFPKVKHLKVSVPSHAFTCLTNFFTRKSGNPFTQLQHLTLEMLPIEACISSLSAYRQVFQGINISMVKSQGRQPVASPFAVACNHESGPQIPVDWSNLALTGPLPPTDNRAIIFRGCSRCDYDGASLYPQNVDSLFLHWNLLGKYDGDSTIATILKEKGDFVRHLSIVWARDWTSNLGNELSQRIYRLDVEKFLDLLLTCKKNLQSLEISMLLCFELCRTEAARESLIKLRGAFKEVRRLTILGEWCNLISLAALPPSPVGWMNLFFNVFPNLTWLDLDCEYLLIVDESLDPILGACPNLVRLYLSVARAPSHVKIGIQCRSLTVLCLDFRNCETVLHSGHVAVQPKLAYFLLSRMTKREPDRQREAIPGMFVQLPALNWMIYIDKGALRTYSYRRRGEKAEELNTRQLNSVRLQFLNEEFPQLFGVFWKEISSSRYDHRVL